MVDTRYCYVELHDAAPTTASAKMKWRNGFAAATLDSEFSNVTCGYAKEVVRYVW